MTFQLLVTPQELLRQANEAFAGKAYKVFLVDHAAGLLNISSTAAAWQEHELITQNGYVAASGTIGVPGYSELGRRVELPVINAQYTSVGAGYAFTHLIVSLQGELYPHSIIAFGEQQQLSNGLSRSFLIKLVQSD